MNQKLLVALAKKYNTPLYVYNADKIASQYKRITTAFAKVPKFKNKLCSKSTFQHKYIKSV